ncbi:MAG: hypothetical protein IT246_03800 [Bacteroidia bacterium]|nr:hypothetical protein [Bacteroidia bacterium]
MSLQDAQQKLSTDISQLYETYQLISKNKQQFNELDMALMQQQLLYVYHSLLKVQDQLSRLPQNNLSIDEVLPLVGLKPEHDDSIVKETEIVDNTTAEEKDEPVAVEVPETVVDSEINLPEIEQEEIPVEDTKVETVIDEIINEVAPIKEESAPIENNSHSLFTQANIETPVNATNEPIAETEITTPKETIQPESTLLNRLNTVIKPHNEIAEKINKETYQSLKQAINLNRKIAFVNHLFNENTVEYAKSIEKLNACTSLHEALRYFNELKHQYNWNNENALVKDLEYLVEKRYS